MKICVFSTVTYWHGISGGMEIHGKLLTEELARRGHKVTIISTRHPEGIPFLEENNVQIHCLKDTTFGSQRKGWTAAARAKFWELDRGENFDLIFSQASAAGGVINEPKKRNVVTVLHGHEGMMLRSVLDEIRSHRTGYKKGIKALLGFCFYYLLRDLSLLHNSKKIIVVSKELEHSVKKLYFLKSINVHTVFNGVDAKHFAPDSSLRRTARKRYGISEADRLLLFFSHVTRQKGIHLLLKVLPDITSQFPSVKLLVVGGGEYLAESKRSVLDMGLEKEVIFAGPVLHEEAASYINACDLFVLPTIRQEGLPFAILEAMACQKPVIATRIGGITSVVRDGSNGILVAPGDLEKLQEAIGLLLAREDLASQLAYKAREGVVKNLTSQIMVDKYLDIFEGLVGKTAG